VTEAGPAYRYAWEKLYAAVQDLAASNVTLRKRLEEAHASHLIRLQAEDVPPELGDDLRALHARMRRDPGLGHEGSVAASARSLGWKEAPDLARHIVRLYDRVTRSLPLLDD
jgi:hypothetical protein